MKNVLTRAGMRVGLSCCDVQVLLPVNSGVIFLDLNKNVCETKVRIILLCKSSDCDHHSARSSILEEKFAWGISSRVLTLRCSTWFPDCLNGKRHTLSDEIYQM